MRSDEPDSGGYAHPLYAASLARIGEPLLLPRSGAWLLRRPIPGTGLADAMGPYPVLSCPHWDGLAADLDELRGVVSVVAVPDAMCGLDAAALRPAFPDLLRPYKRHYVVDLEVPPDQRLSPNHRRNLRRVPHDLRTERADEPLRHLDDWCRLYDVLIARHDIRGVATFSRESFDAQFRVPGLRAWHAVRDGEPVGMVLWYVTGAVAHYHLTAASEAGYRARCVYALLRHALADLAAEGVRRADLGGAAGLDDDACDGLAAFKRGWSTGTVDALLCGRIVDRDAYAELARSSGTAASAYFPAYRAPAPASGVAGDRLARPAGV